MAHWNYCEVHKIVLNFRLKSFCIYVVVQCSLSECRPGWPTHIFWHGVPCDIRQSIDGPLPHTCRLWVGGGTASLGNCYVNCRGNCRQKCCHSSFCLSYVHLTACIQSWELEKAHTLSDRGRHTFEATRTRHTLIPRRLCGVFRPRHLSVTPAGSNAVG